MRAGIPSPSRARFEAERDARLRQHRRWERWAIAVMVLAGLVVVGFWSAVVIVAWHFLGRYW